MQTLILEIFNMEEQKRKRGRPRKHPILPEPIQKIVDDLKSEEEQEFKEIVEEVRASREQKWDVPKDQEIKFFDSRLSYEITGYIPLNEESGLDFDPSWFTEARDTFIRTGHYCEYRRGSKAYTDFWKEQYRRCKYGLTVNGYTVTGDHYYFLNFYSY